MDDEVQTSMDRLVGMLKGKKQLKLMDAAKELGVDKSRIESWAAMLEKERIVELHYSVIGGATLRQGPNFEAFGDNGKDEEKKEEEAARAKPPEEKKEKAKAGKPPEEKKEKTIAKAVEGEKKEKSNPLLKKDAVSAYESSHSDPSESFALISKKIDDEKSEIDLDIGRIRGEQKRISDDLAELEKEEKKLGSYLSKLKEVEAELDKDKKSAAN